MGGRRVKVDCRAKCGNRVEDGLPAHLAGSAPSPYCEECRTRLNIPTMSGEPLEEKYREGKRITVSGKKSKEDGLFIPNLFTRESETFAIPQDGSIRGRKV